ncbi:L-threonine 3-dehydrogenase [bacterium]|nr:L-threonine 3-dehydrogenase [bacterium]
MGKILITGALGQIGSELMITLRKQHGSDNVVVAGHVKAPSEEVLKAGPFETLDATDMEAVVAVVKKHNITTIYHMASILSGTGEKNPQKAWHVNMGGLYNVLEAGRMFNLSLFVPSSIAAFGPTSPMDHTPQDTIQRPTSMYGVTKVAGELLCDYYFLKWGVDVRGLRYPGLISNLTLPGGGTTDYAVEIYYEAIKQKTYSCFLREDTYLDMMYMPDAIEGSIQLMEADPSKLIHRNAFNISAMSFTPKMIAAAIQKYIPDFTITYNIDPVRQGIADSWPNSFDDSAARKEWGWNPKYNLDNMTKDMLDTLSKKLK